MKKFFVFLLFALLTPFALVSANTDDDVWSYAFHLEYTQGSVIVDTTVKFPYEPIPELYSAKNDPATSDFYGVISNVKGKEEARFGFDSPNTTLASGKTPLTVPAPYFADADHVAFYNKAGKHLFDISVKGSSFCNDNAICDARVGEDYLNCPNDCVAPATPPATPPTTINPPTPATVVPTPSPATVQPIAPTATPEPEGEVTKSGGTLPITLSPTVIILLVVSLLLVVLGIVLLRIRKHMD